MSMLKREGSDTVGNSWLMVGSQSGEISFKSRLSSDWLELVSGSWRGNVHSLAAGEVGHKETPALTASL